MNAQRFRKMGKHRTLKWHIVKWGGGGTHRIQDNSMFMRHGCNTSFAEGKPVLYHSSKKKGRCFQKVTSDVHTFLHLVRMDKTSQIYWYYYLQTIFFFTFSSEIKDLTMQKTVCKYGISLIMFQMIKCQVLPNPDIQQSYTSWLVKEKGWHLQIIEKIIVT